MTIERCINDEYIFTSGDPKSYSQRISIQHWQLRDLVSCLKNENDVYCVNQYSVLQYNTQTLQSTSVLKYLTYSPTSMCLNHGYLAVGGQRAQLTVRHLSTNWSVYTSVGGSINNAISIYKSTNGDKRLLVSNNDETIKVYSLPDFQKLKTLEFPTAVNHTAISPDGKSMVAVGDTNQIFLYDLKNDEFLLKKVLYGSDDAGFSCSWNKTSDKFAVASQDGYVNVWDVRSSKKLASLYTKQSSSSLGAARCVKFSPSGSLDLLIYSEHVSYFNIVDARTFNQRQTIRAAPPHIDQNISGITFSPSSQKIYVGLENHIKEYTVDTTVRRCFGAGDII